MQEDPTVSDDLLIIIKHICQGKVHLSEAKKMPVIIHWSSSRLFQSSFNPFYFYSFIYFVFVNEELWKEKGVEGFFSAWEEKNSTKIGGLKKVMSQENMESTLCISKI
jgi:hypothetical protein